MLHPRANAMLAFCFACADYRFRFQSGAAVGDENCRRTAAITVGDAARCAELGAQSPRWPVAMLTLTGVAVGLIVRYMPGHAGPDPATGR